MRQSLTTFGRICRKVERAQLSLIIWHWAFRQVVLVHCICHINLKLRIQNLESRISLLECGTQSKSLGIRMYNSPLHFIVESKIFVLHKVVLVHCMHLPYCYRWCLKYRKGWAFVLFAWSLRLPYFHQWCWKYMEGWTIDIFIGGWES